jgi:tartrate/fumarate subfamily iron-sulfur-dependent hydro-lyase beta chain
VIRQIELPASAAEVASWRVGDVLSLSGVILTARDLAHRRILEAGLPEARLREAGERGLDLPFDPTGLPIFHCGPLARRDGVRWTITGLGPTTSARMESTTPAIMARFATPFLIGKGGMGPATRAALVERGAAYLAAVGGTGALGARAVVEVVSVAWLEELGMPDAVWVLRLSEYGPLVVTMDSRGRDLHEEIVRAAERTLGNASR